VAPSHGGAGEPLLAGKRLLLVDRDSSSREVLTECAQRWGMVPTSTADPDEAASRLAAGEGYDMAVVDLDAAGADGGELLRALPRHCLPVVALAPIAPRSGVCAEAFAGWLTRPVRRSQLLETLRGALGAASPSNGSPLAPAASGLEVLVAEDNPVNQQLIVLFLEKLGHRADVVTDGRTALAALEERAYDVLLMDMQMPDMDGLEASRQIHQRWPERRPRIIGVTANAVAGDRELCLAAGMDDYLSKPFSMDELAHTLAPVGVAAGTAART
jgi:CheY-like chemotaxis protein